MNHLVDVAYPTVLLATAAICVLLLSGAAMVRAARWLRRRTRRGRRHNHDG